VIKHQKYTLVFLLSLILTGSHSVAQVAFPLQLTNEHDSLILTESFKDSTSIIPFLDSIQKVDFREGFLLSSIDQIERKDSSFVVKYFKGDRFKFGKITYDQSQEWLKNYLDYELKKLEGKILAPAQIAKLAESIIVDLENKGYPFVELKLDSSRIVENRLEANLSVERNKFIVMDSIKNIGNAKISDNYLYRYLDIKVGAPYDRRKIKNLKKKIQELSFLKLKEDPKISFVNDKAEIVLNLNKNKSSHFDFIVGLLQNNTPRPENQTLELAFDYPFILDSPFGASLSFKQFRNEDKWIDRSFDLGGQYYLQGNDYFNLYWSNKTSTLITIDTMALLQTKKLPANLDIAYNGIGIGYYREKLNYRFNPSSGYEIEIGTQGGLKKVKPNANIQSIFDEDVDFSTSYDSIVLSSYQLGLHLKASYFQPLNRSITIKTSVNSAYKFNENQLFQNELYRIGGNKILRGFDEQSILSSFYTVLTAELRFILAQQDNNFTLSLPFIDYGFEYNPLREDGEDKWDRPIGVGVGMNFQTKAGIFSFAMAVGKRRGNSFDFGNLKIHFGYVNLF